MSSQHTSNCCCGTWFSSTTWSWPVTSTLIMVEEQSMGIPVPFGCKIYNNYNVSYTFLYLETYLVTEGGWSHLIKPISKPIGIVLCWHCLFCKLKCYNKKSLIMWYNVPDTCMCTVGVWVYMEKIPKTMRIPFPDRLFAGSKIIWLLYKYQNTH